MDRCISVWCFNSMQHLCIEDRVYGNIRVGVGWMGKWGRGPLGYRQTLPRSQGQTRYTCVSVALAPCSCLHNSVTWPLCTISKHSTTPKFRATTPIGVHVDTQTTYLINRCFFIEDTSECNALLKKISSRRLSSAHSCWDAGVVLKNE